LGEGDRWSVHWREKNSEYRVTWDKKTEIAPGQEITTYHKTWRVMWAPSLRI
jgi:hypothetical protein